MRVESLFAAVESFDDGEMGTEELLLVTKSSWVGLCVTCSVEARAEEADKVDSVMLVNARDSGLPEQMFSMSQQQSPLGTHSWSHQQSSSEPPPHRPLQLPDDRQTS